MYLYPKQISSPLLSVLTRVSPKMIFYRQVRLELWGKSFHEIRLLVNKQTTFVSNAGIFDVQTHVLYGLGDRKI